MNRHFFARFAEFFLVVVALICFVIAASDGPYFPTVNFAGLFVLCVIVAILSWHSERKQYRKSIPWRYRPYLRLKTINFR
jgi:uncharacterized membrane protein YphA (DoxX/SURF4 family)